MFPAVKFVDYSILNLMYNSVEFDSMLVVASVEQLHHWFLMGSAVVLMRSYDFVVEMGWKYC